MRRFNEEWDSLGNSPTRVENLLDGVVEHKAASVLGREVVNELSPAGLLLQLLEPPWGLPLFAEDCHEL